MDDRGHTNTRAVASPIECVGSWTIGAAQQRGCTLTPGVAGFLCLDAAHRTAGLQRDGENCL